jgi:hypothetical protein
MNSFRPRPSIPYPLALPRPFFLPTLQAIASKSPSRTLSRDLGPGHGFLEHVHPSIHPSIHPLSSIHFHPSDPPALEGMSKHTGPGVADCAPGIQTSTADTFTHIHRNSHTMTNVAGDDCRPKSSSRTWASTAGWWIQPPFSSASTRLRRRPISTEVSSANWSLTGTFGCEERCDASKRHKSRNATHVVSSCSVLPTGVHHKSVAMPGPSFPLEP